MAECGPFPLVQQFQISENKDRLCLCSRVFCSKFVDLKRVAMVFSLSLHAV